MIAIRHATSALGGMGMLLNFIGLVMIHTTLGSGRSSPLPLLWYFQALYTAAVVLQVLVFYRQMPLKRIAIFATILLLIYVPKDLESALTNGIKFKAIEGNVATGSNLKVIDVFI